MFGKQVEPSIEDRLRLADLDCTESQRELEQLHAEFNSWLRVNNVVLQKGAPVSFATNSIETAPAIHQRIQEFKLKLIEAEQRSQARMRVWAGLKKEASL